MGDVLTALIIGGCIVYLIMTTEREAWANSARRQPSHTYQPETSGSPGKPPMPRK